MANEYAAFFLKRADENVNNAAERLGKQFELMADPYYSGDFHRLALLYPLGHVGHGLFNAARMVKGGLLFLQALVSDPVQAVPSIIGGVALELASALLNVLNTLVACVSILTRTMASAIWGYDRPRIERLPLSDQKNLEIADRVLLNHMLAF